MKRQGTAPSSWQSAESGLFDTARSEALEAVLLIQNIVETIGWTLDYQDLLLAKSKKEGLPAEAKPEELKS